MKSTVYIVIFILLIANLEVYSQANAQNSAMDFINEFESRNRDIIFYGKVIDEAHAALENVQIKVTVLKYDITGSLGQVSSVILLPIENARF